MYYGLIMLSVIIFSGCFAFKKIYRKVRGGSIQATLEFSFAGGIASIIFLTILNGLKFEFTPFTLVMALLKALNGFGFSYCSLKALGRINLSLYSLFSMLGGMVLPFLQGIIFYGEGITAGKLTCFALISVSLLLSFEKGEKKKGLIFYAGIFTLNGMSGVLTKIFTSSDFEKTSPEAFQVLISVCSVVISGILLLTVYRKSLFESKPSIKLLSACAASNIMNKLGNLWLVIALMHVDASVQYPMVTGGTIIVSTLIAFFGKNKPSKKELLSVMIAFAGLLALFAIPV